MARYSKNNELLVHKKCVNSESDILIPAQCNRKLREKSTSRISWDEIREKQPIKHRMMVTIKRSDNKQCEVFQHAAPNVKTTKLVNVSILLDLKELDIEGELRVGRDTRDTLLAVGKVRRDEDAAFTTSGHTSNTDVPALNDLALAQLEGEWLSLLVGYRTVS